jgi:hypothetical protein
MLQEKPTEIYMDNSSAIVLAKNPVFHYRSKHIDTRFHYLRDCITNKEVEVKYVKTQDQVMNIFTKPLKKWCFFLYINIYQDEKYVGSYEEIKFKKGVESKLISEN